MKPIKRSLLPNTCTIYNVWKDPATGKMGHFRSFLRYTRLMDKASTVNVAGIGWTRVVTQFWLVDPVSSVAYAYDESGNKQKKAYVDYLAWEALSPGEKAAHWTLREGDYLMPGECAVVIPPAKLTDLTALKPRKINAIETILDKPGAIHHWEVTLV